MSQYAEQMQCIGIGRIGDECGAVVALGLHEAAGPVRRERAIENGFHDAKLARKTHFPIPHVVLVHFGHSAYG
ncbi:hypothetical protein BGC_16350 [Burkholderia sp. 3C]